MAAGSGRNDLSGSAALQALARVSNTVATAPQRQAVFRAAERAAQAEIGHRLFTIMLFDAASMEVQRLYSSDPGAYPAGGRKAKRDTEWGRRVLERGEPFIGGSLDDIRDNFNDHETIASLGLASVLNMPVTSSGKTLGTMNLLHEQRYYHARHVGPASRIAQMLAPALSAEAVQYGRV